jgi:hypothetical protein
LVAFNNTSQTAIVAGIIRESGILFNMFFKHFVHLKFSETLQNGRFAQAPAENGTLYFLLKKWNIIKTI